MTRSPAIDRERLMTRRTLQVWGSDVLPMTPSAEKISSSLVESGMRSLARHAELVRIDDERVVAIGGGELIEIDVARPPDEWVTKGSPVRYPMRAGISGVPLMIGYQGEVFAMQPDLTMRRVWKGGIVSARSISDGSTVYRPEHRLIFGTWRASASGEVKWRLRANDVVEAALSDVVLAYGRGANVVCRSTETGDLLWTRAGSVEAIVDDMAWLVDGTCVVAYGLDRGDERARIDFKKISPSIRADPDGRGHLFGHRGDYWTIDLRSARVITRFECTNPPRDLYAELPVNDGLLVRSSEHALYYLPIRDGEGPLPPPLWRSDVVITRVVPHRNGLLVITNPSAPRSPTLHWLAPNEHS